MTNLLLTGLASLTGLAVARALGATHRGLYAAVTVYLMSAATIGECGLTAAVCFYVASNPRRAPDYIRTTIVSMAALGLITGVIGVLAAPVLFHHNPETVTPFRMAFALAPVVFLAGGWVFALQGVSMRAWNRARMTQPVMYAVILAVVASITRLTLVNAIYALLASFVLQTAIAWVLRHRLISGGGRYSPALRRNLFGYGLKNLTSTTPSLVNARLDQLVLAVVATPTALGRYAVAVSLSMLAIPVVQAFGNVAMPRIAAGHGARQPVMTARRAALPRSLAVGLVAAALVSAVGPTIPRLLGPSFTDVAPLLWVLAPGAIALGCNRMLGDLLRGANRPLAVARCEGASAVITVVLLAAMIPAFGDLGAAAASTAAYFLTFGLLMREVQKVEKEEARAARAELRRQAIDLARATTSTLGRIDPVVALTHQASRRHQFLMQRSHV